MTKIGATAGTMFFMLRVVTLRTHRSEEDRSGRVVGAGTTLYEGQVPVADCDP